MTPAERHARLKELFFAALEMPPEERTGFLAAACAGDRELEQQLEALLAHDQAESAETASGSNGRPPVWDLTPLGPVERAPPAEIGPYRLLQKLGQGGMGEVWEAEQDDPVRRRLALKVIRWGLASGEVLARFESERQALALMQHPSIAGIYDAGTTRDGRPYFAMELVSGVPITEYCDTHRLTVSERLGLFFQICQAVQHAHQKGVIHRDLKPSNVLVAIEDDHPVPKIIDFGVAKATAQRLTERTLFTELGQWIGTPEYMSPEQAEMSGLDVDTRTDVYSLGALLYELLAGTQPFPAEELRGAGFDEMRRRIREQDPPRPSARIAPEGVARKVARNRRREPEALGRELAGDLDWITLKALEKDRTRRYGSPAELAADLERHLAHLPVAAGPPTLRYRLGKLVRRHRLAVAAGTLAAMTLAIGLVAAGLGLATARQEASSSRQVADFLTGMFRSLDPSAPVAATSVREILDQSAERLTGEFEAQPLVRARLLSAIGQAYETLGAWQQAKHMLEEALEIQRRHLGEDHLEVAATLDVLGWHIWSMREARTAKPMLERAIEIRERALGRDHPEVASSLYSLSWVHWTLSGPIVAQTFLDRALTIQERALGPDHPDVADSLDLKARLLGDAGDLEGARPVLERALAIKERAFGPDHVHVGWTLLNLGRYLTRVGDLEAAERCLERALDIHEKVLGPDSGSVAADLVALARIFHRRGENDASREHYERALAIRERLSIPKDTTSAGILRRLAQLDLEAGDADRGRERLERALAICEQAAASGKLCAAQALRTLARCDRRAGDAPQATDRLERALAILEQIDPPVDLQVAGVLRDLAALDSRRGDTRQAHSRLERALAIGLEADIPGDTVPAVILRDLASLEAGFGDDGNARRRLERAQEIWQRADRPESTYPALIWHDLALIDMRAGDYARARERLERAQQIWQREPERRRGWLAWNDYQLACLSALEGERDTALDRLRAALAKNFSDRILFGDPRLESLRGDPRFDAIVAEVKRRLMISGDDS